MKQKRVDVVLVEQGKARSRTEAQKLIVQGLVSIKLAGLWRAVVKVSEKWPLDALFQVEPSAEQRYVSRAGLKLEAALADFPGSIKDTLALDIGQSTGGFTDCLLQHQVGHVIGIDVGHSQLVPQLREHDRVTVLESYNARYLQCADLPQRAAAGVDLVVMDVSFISQHLILPSLPAVIKPQGWLISLVKPQFELDRAAIGKNGIVKNEASYILVKEALMARLHGLHFDVVHYQESPIKGGDGNREFLITARYRGCDPLQNYDT